MKNAYISHLFDLQSSILHNHVHNKLIIFFLTEENNALLYETILITKDVTKKEMISMGKKPPNTQKYSLYANKTENKLTFVLKHSGLSDIEIYNVVLTNERPSIQMLKTIVRILISKCRPMPSKVDSKFSMLASKYKEYLECYQVKMSWQNGYFAKYTQYKRVSTPKNLINSAYEKFLEEVSSMVDEYRTFTKILIDIYNRKTVKYQSTGHVFTLNANYIKEFGISLMLDDSTEQHYTHEIIPLKNFTPSDPLFKNKYGFFKGVIAAVASTFTKT
jgi:hypothetical protein